MENKLKVLSNIAHSLNNAGITWALGASGLLYMKGMVDAFHDLDIVVAEDDADKVKDILQDMGTMHPQKDAGSYTTKYFYEFVVDGVDVDVIAGFGIVTDEKEYYFPLQKEHIVESIFIDKECIFLHSIDEWRKYYTLMKRVNKVKILSSIEY